MNLNKKIYSNKYLILFDQLIVSFSNFILSVILIKLAGLVFFGKFTLVWILILFLNSLQLSLIISPLMSNYSKQNKVNKNHYLGGVFIQQIALSFLTILTLFIILNSSFFYSKLDFIELINYQILLFVFIYQVNQLLRRFFLVEKLYLKAVFLDFFNYFIFYILLLSGYFLLNLKFSINNIFFILNISFCIGILLNINYFFKLKFSKKIFRSSTIENWSISKWMTVASIFQWYSSNIWIITIGSIFGPYYVGVIRGCQSIINVANVAFQAFENYYPSKISEIFVTDKKIKLKVFFKNMNKYGIISTLILSIVIILLSKFLLITLYNDKLGEYFWFLSALSLILPLIFLQFPINYIFRTFADTRPIFISFLMSSFFSLLFSKYIISNFELIGFLIGIFSVQIIILSIQYIFLRKLLIK